MKRVLRFSGQTVELKGAHVASVEDRPGGWLVVTLSSGERLRLQASVRGTRLGFSLPTCALQAFSGELLEQSHGSGSGLELATDLTAQFPGKVRKVVTQASATPIEPGTVLVLLEAMKMEFAIKAPSRGVLRKVLVTEGQQVSPGQALVDFEGVQE